MTTSLRGRLIALVALALVTAVVLNAQSVARASIHLYQRTLSPVAVRAGLRCRFAPTCSRYADLVIEREGVVRGGWRALKRVARCNPWTEMGTRDDP
jgi:putative membrane protein insertion efficiency factor